MGAKRKLVVGVVRRGPDKGMLQLRPEPANAIPEERLEAFFGALARTANGKGSARAAGICHSVIWRRKQRDPAFRKRWEDALLEGYALLEEQVLAGVLAATRAQTPPRGADGKRALVQAQGVALRVLALNARRVAEIRERRAEARDPDEVMAELREKLGVIRARALGVG